MDDLLKDLIRAWTEVGVEVAKAARAVRQHYEGVPEEEICRWRKSSEGWVLVGERAALLKGEVLVKAKNKPRPDRVQVENVRLVDGVWSATKVKPMTSQAPRKYFSEVGDGGDLPDPRQSWDEDIPF